MGRIDARTKTMSPEALTCRTWRHAMVPLPTPARVRAEYRAKGQRWVKLVCSRGCSYWRELVIDRDTEEVVSARSGYTRPDEYLVQARGTGRLPTAAARSAFWRVAGEK